MRVAATFICERYVKYKQCQHTWLKSLANSEQQPIKVKHVKQLI